MRYARFLFYCVFGLLLNTYRYIFLSTKIRGLKMSRSHRAMPQIWFHLDIRAGFRDKPSFFSWPHGVLPDIVTVNVSVIILEEGSTAVYVIVVVPSSKVSPGLWLDVNVTVPELSLAVGSVHVTIAFDKPPSVFWVISDGIPAIVGSSGSIERR